MITHVLLRNYKCFLELSLQQGLMTLLSGVNCSGKSSFIQALLLLRQSYLQRRLNGLSLHGELCNIGLSSDALSEFADKDEIYFKLQFSDNSSGTWTFDALGELDYLRLKSKKVTSKMVYSSSLFSTGFRYLIAERNGPRVVQQRGHYTVMEEKSIGIAGEFVGTYLAMYGSNPMRCPFRGHPAAISDSFLSQTEAWLSEISPGTRLNTEDILGTDQIRITYSTEIPTGVTNKYRATNVGFGLSYALPVIVSALSSAPDDLLIIDSPEAHLHPRGQSKMGELLARTSAAGVQIICETHSDHVLNSIRLAVKSGILEPQKTEFYFFTKKLIGDDLVSQVDRICIDKNGRFDNWPSGFLDEWTLSLQNLLI